MLCGMSKLAERWGEAIREARLQAGLTQVQLAERLGCDQQDVSRYERGQAAPRDEMRMKVAHSLGVPVGELFSYPEQPTEGVA